MPHEQRVDALLAAFRREFGRAPQGIAEAPGRVNLIGEHVDYNDGLVLPFAIDRTVLAAWAPRDDGELRCFSADYAEHARIAASATVGLPADGWPSYVAGVRAALAAAGHTLLGLDLAVSGDVPQGAGLSSSAALEVAVAAALRDASTLPVDDVDLARLCQRAEDEYVGVQCGIMDQFAAALSRRGHALLIDCATLAHEAVPLRLAEAGLAAVVANSAVTRTLAASAYNERRHDCERAVALLRTRLSRPGLASLRDVSMAEIDRIIDEAGDSAPLRRARHVVTEIARVAAAADALARDGFAAVGDLMQESHRSLRDDYEVSSPQLDLLVGLATAQDYVVGARLTGAGFGGCTINLVRADAVDAFERDVIAAYRQRTSLPAEMYATAACDGLRAWRL